MKLSRECLILALALAASSCARRTPDHASRLAATRIVNSPSSIAYVSTDREVSSSSGEFRFGGPLGRSALYLKFPREWQAHGIPVQAFLTLFAREGSASTNTPVTLEVWRVSAEWQPRTLQHWSAKPGLAPPYARARVTASPAQELRIDITNLMRFAAQNPERDFGIGVIASGSEGPGLSFSSGLAGGLAPRLELYLR